MNRRLAIIVAAGGTAIGGAGIVNVAQAQTAPAAPEEKTGAPAAKNEPFFHTELSFAGDYTFSGDVDGGGEVSVSRAFAALDLAHDFSDSVRGTLLIESEFSWYHFKDATGLIAGTSKPWSQLALADISPGVSFKINEQWRAVTGLLFRFAGENDVDVSDSFTWGGYVAGRYSPSQNFSLTLGVRVNSRLEEDWRILPALAMDWHVNQTVRVQLVPSVGGEALRVSSKLNDRWSFLIDGEYASREYRLNDETPLASGVVRDWRVTVGVGVLWRPTDKIEVTARGGMVGWQEFRVDDRDGNQQSKVNTDPSPYVYLGATFTF